MRFSVLRPFFLSLALLLLAVGIFFVVALQDQPVVAQATTPKPENVQDAREFMQGLRAAIQTERAEKIPFVVTQTQLNSVITLGVRFIPGFRGQIVVAGDQVAGTISIPVSYAQDTKWINLEVTAPTFDGQFALGSVKFGGIQLPPGLTLQAGRVMLNTVFGNDLGDTVISAATRMDVTGETVSFDLAIDQLGKNGVMRGVFGTLRGDDMPATGAIDRYYTQLRRAMEQGILPTQGSYLPYLHFTLAAAYEGGKTEGFANAYTAAMFALTRACGARDFTMIVGGLGGAKQAEEPDWQRHCDDVTLNGRIDSRRHFTTAAALQAASNRGFAGSVGEFKELYDSRYADKGGFDFTDLAANNSGIRLSNTLMATAADGWLDLLSRIESEGDVIISFDGLPQIMTRTVFEQKYRDVDSPEYATMLARIEASIDALALHR